METRTSLLLKIIFDMNFPVVLQEYFHDEEKLPSRIIIISHEACLLLFEATALKSSLVAHLHEEKMTSRVDELFFLSMNIMQIFMHFTKKEIRRMLSENHRWTSVERREFSLPS